MVQELLRDETIASEFVRFRFDQPEKRWPISDCADFFANVAPLCELLTVVDSWPLMRHRLMNNSTYESHFPDGIVWADDDVSDIPYYYYSDGHPLVLVRLLTSQETDVVSFSFNSPISVVINAGIKVSKIAVVKLLSAYKRVAHYSAVDRKLHAEADLADQVAFKAKLENIKIALKLHETIKDPEMQHRFAEVVHDTLLPFARMGGPRLKSIELTDDTK